MTRPILVAYKEDGQPLHLSEDLVRAGFTPATWTAPVAGWYEIRCGEPPRLLGPGEPDALSWRRDHDGVMRCNADDATVYMWKGALICSKCGHLEIGASS